MTTLETALDLTEKVDFFVFPVAFNAEENTKKPLTENGHLDATQDPGVITDWWTRWPDARIGVAAGKSRINVADIDTKNGKDGWEDLSDNWYDYLPTYSYDTGTGGTHLVFEAPEGLNLFGNSKYRGMPGVDRRAGSSWVMWVGGVPSSRKEFAASPDWLNDEKSDRPEYNFEGDLQDWFESLVPGEPNALVRRAIQNVDPDMGHSDMVAAQHHAIRLGAEGNPGVPNLLDAICDAWMNRPAENHTTPEGEWEHKFQEALLTGLEKYGDAITQLKNLPEYTLGLVPAEVSDSLVQNDTGKPGFSKLLAALVRATDDDDRIASILWNCPATMELSREWGLLFVYQRVQSARVIPEPVKENPKLEEERERREQSPELASSDLLSADERELVACTPSFAEAVQATAEGMGYDQLGLFRSAGWTMAGMAFGFKGFVPVSGTQKHGLNLWNISIAMSGSGKTVIQDFRDQVLRLLFEDDNPEGMAYDLGTDSSPQGLHKALLERDRKASLFAADEASGFFKTLGKREWDAGLEDTLSKWYNGFVPPANKISMQELRGKSALTSFSIQMFATPDRLVETLSRDQFKSGFLARFNWVIGNPPKESDDRFNIFKDTSESVKVIEEEGSPLVIQHTAADLLIPSTMHSKPVALIPSDEAAKRLGEAYERMFLISKNRKNWDIIEPAITRLMEAMLKTSGICAMYRGDTKINLVDALHGIAAVEEWLANLHIVAEDISDGTFQKNSTAMREWIAGRKGGRATRTQIFHQFSGMIERDSRELDNYLTFLLESGAIVRDESGGVATYSINGGLEKS